MSYSLPEQIDSHERPGPYKKHLKRKRVKAERRLRKQRDTGGRVKVPMRGYSS